MHTTNLSALDLNLLVVLDALLRERHVGRAAAAVGRSQPAISHALARLRGRFHDPLLVPAGRRMILSPRAESLRMPVAAILRNVGDLFREPDFDPATTDRHFRMMMPDFMAETMLPRLLTRFAKTAPQVRLEIAEWRGERTLTREYLENLDCVVSYWSGRFFDWQSQPLLEDRDVLAMRTGKRGTARRRGWEELLAAPHVAIVGPGEIEDPVDTWLRSIGRERNIILRVPSYLLALRTIAATSVVGILPHSFVSHAGAAMRVAGHDLPIDPGADAIHLHYAAATESDAAGLWLRKQIVGCV